MNFVNLIKLVCSRKQRKQRQNLKENASYTPYVHFIPVMPIGKQTLRRAVPSSRNVFSQRWFGIDTSTRSKICQFDHIIKQQNVFRLDVSMKNSLLMHVRDCFHQLINVKLYSIFREIMGSSFNCFIHVHFHKFKH